MQSEVIKKKKENDTKVRLNTSEFDQLLDDIIAYAHSEERKLAARLERRLEAEAQATRFAAAEVREKEQANLAVQKHEEQRKRKLSMLHAMTEEETSLEGQSAYTAAP